jgi:hypothetical protein
LTKGRVEVSNLFDDDLILQPKLDSFNETHVGLDKSHLTCSQAEESHHSPSNWVTVVNDVGLTYGILSLCELTKLQQTVPKIGP